MLAHKRLLLSSLGKTAARIGSRRSVLTNPRPLNSRAHVSHSACRWNATTETPPAVPLRKQLKEDAKKRKKLAKASANAATSTNQSLSDWELTVGIEVHAELNTAHKLFSSASTSSYAPPNSHVARFDAALPGAQPEFQVATLIPALRAALALNCEIQAKSSWDRKHYFYQDQPNGYQITQYYEPFARNGCLTLSLEDGIDPSDGAELSPGQFGVSIGIQQVQMEQDTAKTALQPPSTYLLDFNRVSHPLIEIITLPQIHSPATAAATVRKIQALLKSVDACVAGMEMGGLRADVNVSVRRRSPPDEKQESSTAKRPLGTRTEIKNLSSLKAVEDAVAAERDRQIRVLEAGGVIEGETRGWTIGSTETTRLRSKEGEVDYRYMPDPDLSPLFISEDLVDRLRTNQPETPDHTIRRIMDDFNVTMKDAKTLFSFDDGERVEFVAEVVDKTMAKLEAQEPDSLPDRSNVGRIAVNWVLHEMGGLLTFDNREWAEVTVTADDLASILANLESRQITARVAKQILQQIYSEDVPSSKSVDARIDEQNLRSRPMSMEDLKHLARTVMDENPAMVSAVLDKGQRGKAMWFVGQIVRRADEGTVEADKAREVIDTLLRELSVSR